MEESTNFLFFASLSLDPSLRLSSHFLAISAAVPHLFLISLFFQHACSLVLPTKYKVGIICIGYKKLKCNRIFCFHTFSFSLFTSLYILHIMSLPEEIEVTLGKGVAGTITIPHSLSADDPFEDGYAPATHKMALFLHGQGGHRDYCYQKMLAHKLASDLGIYSLRIDFRGCGSSADNANEAVGRVLSQDVEDVQACAEFVMDGTKNPLGINFVLSSIIAHSRGGVAAFLWAIEQNKKLQSGHAEDAIIVPNIVNCSARYTSSTVLERYNVYDEDQDSYPQQSLRHGKLQTHLIPRHELVSLAEAGISGIRELTTDTSVLSIYGHEDMIIPVYDPGRYANALNRGYYSHQLDIIPGADHNFYGTVPIENEDDAKERNPHNYPLNKRNFVNYNYAVVEKVLEFLKPENELIRFLHRSNNMGQISRWKDIEGVSNFRDAGGWRIDKPTFKLENHPPNSVYYVKPEVIYRCANTANITKRGLESLQKLKINVMFDLRSDGECVKDGVVKELEKYGVKRVHAPVFSADDYSPNAIALRYSNLITSWYTYVNVYDNMLELGTSSYKTIFEYIRDDGRPFVFHCTAGKDRTGVIGMLILLLLGVDKHTIAREYELTTIGLKPDHAKLRASYMETIRILKEKAGAQADDLERMITRGRKNWTVEEDGFQNLISSRYEAMLATIEAFNEKFGGILNYMKDILEFSDSDILKMYNNLVAVYSDGLFEYSTISDVVLSHKLFIKSKI